MKRLLMIILLSVVFIPFAHAGDSKPIEMKLGHFAADAHPGNLASKMFAEAGSR
jgi:TRAP-type C4-dicarboxylate transport system substrate-binding protein